MRLFIAIPLSEEMKKALVTCMHDLKKQGVEGNYVPAQNLHLTLAFIGEYDDTEKAFTARTSPREWREGEGGAAKRADAALPDEPVGEREFWQSPVGGSKRESKAENLCEGSAGGAERGRDSLRG